MTLPLAALLQGAVAGEPTGQTYVDDVFSTYLYTGNSSTQTITNGIDLAGKGGLIWIKERGPTVTDHMLHDSTMSIGNGLSSNSTAAINGISGMTALNSNGFSLENSGYTNTSTRLYTSWTFRKAPKFFDMVTYTGTGSSQTISHSLNQTVGVLVIKRISGTGNWATFARTGGAAGATQYAYFNTSAGLNLTAAAGATGIGAEAAGFITSTGFKPNDLSGSGGAGNADNINENGSTYVAYLFAHDTSTDGIIQCGIYTGNGSTQEINLGIEPQFLMVKGASITNSSWLMLDNMRGFPVSGNTARLDANSSGAEFSTTDIAIRNNGFWVNNDTNTNSNGQTYIYLAIRRPNKPPTSGTQVYNAIAYTANNTDGRKLSGIGFPPDLVSIDPRSSYTTPGGPNWFSRLTGNGRFLTTASTSAELDGSSNSNGILGQDDFTVSRIGTNVWSNVGSYLYILHAFRRAPGVFDVVCGDSGNATVARAHSLGVKPELIIAKYRDIASQWDVYCDRLNGGVNQEDYYLELNGISAQMSSTDVWGAAGPSASYFYKSVVAPYKAVFYLFATLPGISKVGSYTGNGASQTINCGFTTGARFILIKRTDSTGDWFVWDSVRGIIAGNDPHLSLNTTAAEVTTDDSVDPDNSGFIVNQLAATNINVTSATYIYLAYA